MLKKVCTTQNSRALLELCTADITFSRTIPVLAPFRLSTKTELTLPQTADAPPLECRLASSPLSRCWLPCPHCLEDPGAVGTARQKTAGCNMHVCSRGSVAEWFRALVLYSGGPGFKASTLPLAPSSNAPSRFVDSQLVCLPQKILHC